MQGSQLIASGHTILIADDDADLLILTRIKLQMEGFKVFVASNAAELYEILENEHVDMIMLDILINTESGAELCYQLKHDPTTKDTPILLFSGHHKLSELIEESGADGFLPKPLDMVHLKSVIGRLLNQP
jgi:DNA-binding response OmpR family regulator